MTYTELARLPFRKFYAVDFEYSGSDGEIPSIVCMVVQDLRSGEVSRYWQNDLQKMKTPPFETGEDIALVCYFAPAEVQSMLALGWELDVSIIDRHTQFRGQTNGNHNEGRNPLASALLSYR